MARLYLIGIIVALLLGALGWYIASRKRRAKDQPFTGNADMQNADDAGSPADDVTSRFASESWESQARALAKAGRKIEAIKLVRERTGLDLKAAKDRVDSW